MKKSIIKKCLILVLPLLFTLPLQSVSASTSQTECINSVVWAEARGESKLGQQAVAHVILNRSRQFKRDCYSIVRQRGQFKMGRPPNSFRVDLSSRDPTNGATHFRTKDMPMWLGLKKKIRIGGHTFYGK